MKQIQFLPLGIIMLSAACVPTNQQPAPLVDDSVSSTANNAAIQVGTLPTGATPTAPTSTPVSTPTGVLPSGVTVIVPPDQASAQLATLDQASQIAPWAGVYRGNLPCTNCERVEAMVTLADDGSFMMAQRFVGQHNTTQTTGRLVWDDEQSVVTLVTTTDQYRFRWFPNQLQLLSINHQPDQPGAVLSKL